VTIIHGIHNIKPLNAELNPICCLLALLGAHHFLHFSRIRVKTGPWQSVHIVHAMMSEEIYKCVPIEILTYSMEQSPS